MKKWQIELYFLWIDISTEIKDNVKKWVTLLHYLWLDLCFDIRSWRGKVKRSIWNRGIKLQWNRLWIRKDEFHESLDMDARAIFDMDQRQRDAYMKDLMRRRQIAHDRDLEDH